MDAKGTDIEWLKDVWMHNARIYVWIHGCIDGWMDGTQLANATLPPFPPTHIIRTFVQRTCSPFTVKSYPQGLKSATTGTQPQPGPSHKWDMNAREVKKAGASNREAGAFPAPRPYSLHAARHWHCWLWTESLRRLRRATLVLPGLRLGPTAAPALTLPGLRHCRWQLQWEVHVLRLGGRGVAAWRGSCTAARGAQRGAVQEHVAVSRGLRGAWPYKKGCAADS
eukprot:226111-Chlamydomonas_euryale.AAC.3